MRHIQEKTVWYWSSADDLLAKPVAIPSTRLHFGDLYIHYASGQRKQIWMRTADGQWEAIKMYHPHPYLSGYVLNIISNGEPSWVKATTIRTYEGRKKKQQREAAKSSKSPEGESVQDVPKPLVLLLTRT